MQFLLPSNNLSWLNQLAPGNDIAAQYGTDTSVFQALQIQKMIWDLTPKDYLDVKLFMLNAPEVKKSHTFLYTQMPYQRKSAITPVLSAGIAAASVQVVPITNPNSVSPDMILIHPITEQKVIVRNVLTGDYTMTIAAYELATLPALVSGTTYIFPQHGTVDGDLSSKITQMQRVDELITRSNHVQMFSRGTTFGRVERYEWENNATVNYMEKNDAELLRQHHIDIGNATWNGTKGMVRLSNGNKAMLMDGIIPSAISSGALQASCTTAQLFSTIIDVMESTRFGTNQVDKAIFATPRMIAKFAQVVKYPLVRFKATNDNGLSITLNGFEWQTGRVMFVPVQRFQQESNSFPVSWENKIFIGNPETFHPCITFPEKVGFIGGRDTNPYTENNFDMKYIEGTWSGYLENGKDWGIITVS